MDQYVYIYTIHNVSIPYLCIREHSFMASPCAQSPHLKTVVRRDEGSSLVRSVSYLIVLLILFSSPLGSAHPELLRSQFSALPSPPQATQRPAAAHGEGQCGPISRLPCTR